MIFQQILNPDSIEHKFFLCPFVANFPVGGVQLPSVTSQNSSRTISTVKTLKKGSSTVANTNSVVDDYLEQIEQQQALKMDP